MARVLQVEIVGDYASAERAFKKTGAAANGFEKDLRKTGSTSKTFERDLGKTTRGVLAGSGAFRTLGRSVAFASASFLGGAGLIEVAKSSIDAAEGLNVSTVRLSKVVDNLGLSYRSHTREISAALTAEEKLSAFTKQDLTDSLGRLIPATHNVALGLKDVSLAADIARGRNIDLQTATQIVVKATEGQIGQLKRMGIAIQPVKTAENALIDSHKHFTTSVREQARELDQNASALKAVAQLQTTYGGNAKSATTETQKFADETHQLRVEFGEALLPELNHLLPKVTDYIQKMIDSGKVSKDTKIVIHDLGIVAHEAFGIFKDGQAIFGGFSDVVGGDKHAIELLTAAFIAFKLRGVGALLTGVGTAEASLAGLRSAAELTATRVGIALGIGSYAGVAAAGGVAAVGLAGVGAVVWGFTHADNTSIPVPGKPGQQVTRTSDGHFILSKPTAGRGGSATQRTQITAAQARALVPGAFKQMPAAAPTHGPGGAHGGAGSLFGTSLAGENPMIPQALQALAAAGYSVDVTSGLRTEAQQAALYARYVKSGFNKKYIAAKPGQSNHETGNAVDVFVNGKPVDQSPGALALLKKYGLVSDVPGDHEHLDLKGYGGSGSTSVDPASVAALVGQGTTTAKHPKIHTVSGIKLLPAGLQIALSQAAGTKGLADNQSALKDAIAYLKKHDTGSNKVAVTAELGKLEKQLNSVDTTVTNQVKAKAKAVQQAIAKVKSTYAPRITDAQQAVSTAFQQLSSDIDAAFQAATQKQVDALGKQFFQNGAQTPLEAQLAAMQGADQQKSLQDSLDQAKKQLAGDQNPVGNLVEHIVDVATGATTDIFSGAQQVQADQLKADQDAVDAAQRAIDENDLATKATAERAKADADYADAVTTLTNQRTLQERELTDTLSIFGSGLLDGSKHIGDINSLLGPFGVSLKSIPAGDLALDMGGPDGKSGLVGSTVSLASVMLAEAAALKAAGDLTDAQIITARYGLNPPSGTPGTTTLPGGIVVPSGVLGGGLGGAFKVPAFAAGGFATGATLGVFGEAGPEMVLPLTDSRALSSVAAAIGGGDIYLHNVIKLGERVVFESVQKQAKLSVNRGGSGVPS